MKKEQLTLFLSNAVLIAFAQQERPNILLLTIEDTSWYEFACYGNNSVETPNIDQLARDGIMFQHAYSNSPQSSPARSGLITGSYATTYAMEKHRSNPTTPTDIFYPQLLRAAGYYCTNNQKTDYNTTLDNKAIWDECHRNASYNSTSRPEGTPFFSIYNAGITHMGRVRSFHTDERRDFTQDNIFVDNAPLPAHLPDLPEIRSDYAFHLEGVKDVDKWVGMFVSDLKARELYDNTIIFFFSDHGGCSPRGKGYLYETGLRVPMIVHVPEQYRDQFGITEELAKKPVCFVDLAPTFMQIAGVESPAHYQGESFFKPLNDGEVKYQYGVSGNQANHFQPLRSVTDGRYKYIRRFIPYKQHALRNNYQWGMPANIAWDLAYQEGRTNEITSYPFECKVAEELYDLSVDSFETNNLAQLPGYASQLSDMREKIDSFVVNTRDLGFVLPIQRENLNVFEYAHAPGYPLEELHRLANLTCRVELSDLPDLETALTSSYEEIRFWAVVNLTQLALQGKITTAPTGLKALLDDPSLDVAAEAAYSLCYLGEKDAAMDYFMSKVRSKKDYGTAMAMMEVLALDARADDFYTPTLVAELKTYVNTGLKHPTRAILINLKEMPADEYWDDSVYQEGLNVNHDRRGLTPVPGGASAYVPFFEENFTPIDGITKVPLATMEGSTDVPGWLCSPEGVFAQASGQLGGGIRLTSSDSNLAWAETPELDLSEPVVLEFYSKKWTNTSEGTFHVVVGKDTIYTIVNPNNTISPRTTESFVAAENTRIRFVGSMVANSNICFDSVRVSPTFEPTLNLPLAKVVDMGKTTPGSVLNYRLPVKIFNGSAKLTFNFPHTDIFNIQDEIYTIELEDMTNRVDVDFVFDAPEEEGEYSIPVEVDGGIDFPTRVIWLHATVDDASGVTELPFACLKIIVDQKSIRVQGERWTQAKLYSLRGQLLDFASRQDDTAELELTASDSGIFLLKVSGTDGVAARKILIH